MSDENGPVIFLMPDGTEVSNDPRFFQMRMSEQVAASSPSSLSDTEVSLPSNFDELKGKDLQALAKDLQSKGVDIDTAGVTKVGDLREAIRTGVENYDPNAKDLDLTEE